MRYDAFISYRHAELDLFIAKQIHKGLETFKVPGSVRKKSGKKKINRVFRDQEELPIGSDLGSNIEAALQEAEYLIVICSPRTPASYWVQKEIETFIRLHDRNHILAVLIEGEPNESFPPLLLNDEEGNPVEPLAADVRGKDKREIKRKMKTELLRLAAPLLHCSYDDLRQRHRERRIRKMMALMAAASLVFLAFGVYSAYNASVIRQNYQAKQVNQSKYLADTSQQLLKSGDRIAAIEVALEALPVSEKRPYVAQAQNALAKALNSYQLGMNLIPNRTLEMELPVSDFYFGTNAKYIVTVDRGGTVYAWKTGDGTLLAKIYPTVGEDSHAADTWKAVLNSKNQILVIASDGVHCYDLTGKELWKVQTQEPLTAGDYSEASDRVLGISSDTVYVVDGASGKKIAEVQNQDSETTSYIGKTAFNGKGTQAIVAKLQTSDTEQTNGSFTRIDLTDGKSAEYQTKESYISKLLYLDDQSVIAADYAGDMDMTQASGTGTIEKISLQDNSCIWSSPYTFQITTFTGKALEMRHRSYTDSDGVLHDTVIYTIDGTIAALDTATGQMVSSFVKSSSIDGIALVDDSGLAILMERNGNLDYVNLDQNQDYPDNTYATNFTIMDAKLYKGILAIRQYQSPELVLMSAAKGNGYTELHSFDKSVNHCFFSSDQKYMAVDCYNDQNVYVFDRKSGKLVDTVAGTGLIGSDAFIGNDTLVTYTLDGKLTLTDLSDKKEKKEAFDAVSMAENSRIDTEHGLFLAYGMKGYVVYDLLKQKQQAQETLDSTIETAAFSGDGSRFCYVTDDNQMWIRSTGDFSEQQVKDAKVKVLFNGDIHHAVCVNTDGSLAAVNCQDGAIRVIDLGTAQVLDTIAFRADSQVFMKFSPDSRNLLMQGDNGIFESYDLQKKQTSYISKEQYYKIKDATFYPEQNMVVLDATGGSYILNADTYECAEEIEDAKGFDPAGGEVYAAFDTELVKFPYETLSMLYQEAAKQVGNHTLSEQKRIQYHID